jgi:dihydrofolate reductase
MIDTPKVVFSRTLKESIWENTTLAKGDYVDVINQLKNQPGGDIIVYGGATFVSSLIRANLIDEYNLFINPAAIGNGMAIFKNLEGKQKLTLVESLPFGCGIVLIRYKTEK